MHVDIGKRNNRYFASANFINDPFKSMNKMFIQGIS